MHAWEKIIDVKATNLPQSYVMLLLLKFVPTLLMSSVFVFIARDIWKQFRFFSKNKKFMRPSTGVKKSVTEPVNFNTFYIQEELNKFAAHGDLENVERLLCLEGIDVNWRDVRYGMTPLICAAASGYDLVHSILRISLVLI